MPPAPPPALPAHTRVSQQEGALEVSRPWSRLHLLYLVLLGVVIGCGSFGQQLIASRAETLLPRSWLGYPMMGLASVAGAVIVYLLVLTVLNRMTLRAEQGRLRMSTGPLPWPPAEFELRTEDIALFIVTPWLRVRQGASEFSSERYALVVVDRRGKRRVLVMGLETDDQGLWLVHELRRTLGLTGPRP